MTRYPAPDLPTPAARRPVRALAPSPPRRPARAMRRVHALVSAALLALLLTTGPALSPDHPPAASAAGLGPTTEADSARALGSTAPEVLGPGRWHRTKEGRTWYGAYRSLEDGFAYCVDAGRATPLPRFFSESTGRAITSPRTAWALHTHSGSERRDVQSALSALAKLDEQVPHRHVIAPELPADLGPGFRGAAAEFTAISEDAERFAGPYTLHLDIAEFAPGAHSTTVRIRLVSAAGEPVPGIPVDLEASGGLLRETSVTTAAEPVEVALRAIPRLEAYEHAPTQGAAGPGERPADDDSTGEQASAPGDGTLMEVDVTARAHDVPPTSVRFHEAQGQGATRVQNVIAADAPDEIITERSRTARSEPAPSPAPPTYPAPSPPAPAPSAPSSPTPTPVPTPEPSEPEPAPSESTPAAPEPEPAPSETPAPTATAPEHEPAPSAEPDHEPTPPAEPGATPSTPAPGAPAPGAPETRSSAPAEPAGGPAPEAPAEPEPAQADELPRTGPTSGSRALLGLSLVLIGTGAGALVLGGRARRK